MESLEELKDIIENAPEGATHIDCDGDYWKMDSQCASMLYDHDGWNYCEPQEYLRSLSDIKRIIELMEINEAMHRQVAGYLTGADWQNWQDFNKSKFEVIK